MKILRGIGALALVVALAVGAFEAIAFILHKIAHQLFHGVNPTVTAASITAVATVLVAAATLTVGRYAEKRKAIDVEIRASKIPAYTKIVSGLFTLLTSTEEPGRQAAAEQVFREAAPELINWASDDVVIAWSKWRRDAGGMDPKDAIVALEKVLIAIRKDYGHSGRKMSDGDLLGLFINDIDDIIAESRKRLP